MKGKIQILNIKYLCLIAFLFVMSSVYFAQTTLTYSTSGTYKWMCPVGVTTIQVECWGAGGGSGSIAIGSGAYASAGGGAGGGYVKHISYSVTPGTTYTIVVGAKGTGGTGGSNGVAGGDSYFESAALVKAGGGGGGTGVSSWSTSQNLSGGSASANVCAGCSASYTGGAGGNGISAKSGGGGSSAGTSANGNDAVNNIAGSAPTGGGAGAAGQTSSNLGTAASALGGGGGAPYSTGAAKAGGDGYDGKLVLTYTIGTCTDLFNQDFSSSSTLSDYHSNGNDSGEKQFTKIGGSASISSGTLLLTATNDYFARSTDFSGSPTSLMISFDFNVTSCSSASASGNAAQLYISDNVTNNTTSPSPYHDIIHFGTATTPSWTVYNKSSLTASSTQTTSKKITIYSNNSGASISYLAPDGTTQSVGDDVLDLWIGTTQFYNEYAYSTTTTRNIYEIYFKANSGTATYVFDNFLIEPITVSTSAVTATSASSLTTTSFSANWTTGCNATTYYLDVSTNSSFSSYVAGFNNLNVGNVSTYSVTGLSAETIYYYRVRWSDGTNTYANSNIIQVGTGCTTPKSGTLKVGPGGSGGSTYTPDFTTLSQATSVLRSGGCGYSGNIILELQYDYVSTSEYFPIDFTGLGGSSSTITVRPSAAATGLTISGSKSGGSIVDFGGADYIYFDGRPSGTGTTSQLTISNTAAAASGNMVFIFQNGSTNNSIQYCTIKCDNSSISSSSAGVINFGLGTSTSANSNNTIDNCAITYYSVSTKCLIVANNSSSTNSSNIISNNELYNFGKYGLWCDANNSSWTISGNSLYQTAAITDNTTTGGQVHALIYVNSGSGYTINGNFLGSTAKNCSSTSYFVVNDNSGASSWNLLYGIYIGSVTGTTKTNITNNYIKYLENADLTSNSSGSLQLLSAIFLSCSGTKINIENNVIQNLYTDFTNAGAAASVNAYAIAFDQSSTYNGVEITLSKNFINNITAASTSNATQWQIIDLSYMTSTVSGGVTPLAYIGNNYLNIGTTAIGNMLMYGYQLPACSTYFYNNTVSLLRTTSNQTQALRCVRVQASNVYYIYNNIFVMGGSSASTNVITAISTPGSSGTVSTATIYHDNNYYNNQGYTNSQAAIVNTTGYTSAQWEKSGYTAITNCTTTAAGQSSTAAISFSDPGVPSGTDVATLIAAKGKDLSGDTYPISDDIIYASRAVSPYIGCFEGTATIYYTNTAVASTDANATGNWKPNRDGTGSSPGGFTTAGTIFIVQPGHKYRLSAGWTGNATGYVKVESGGALDLNSYSPSTWASIKLTGSGVSSSGSLLSTSITGATSCSIPIILLADSKISSSGSGGGITLTGGITGTGYALTIDGTYATTISTSGINTSTGGTLIKSGSGTLTISASGTYTGATTISAGVVNVQNAAALGTSAAGTTVASGAALQLQGAAVVSEALTLSGTGVSSDGAMRFISGTNSWSGAISLSAASRINSDAGTNTITGGITGTGYALTIGGAGGGTISTSGINTSISGTLTKDGAGTWIISASGSYTGLTTISAGVLDIQNATALGTTAAGTTVASGSALQLQGGITVGAEALTLNNDGVGSAGSLRNVSGANTWGGNITLSTNAVRINSDASTLTLSGTITNAAINLTFGGAGNITANGVIGSGAGTLTKDGAGTLTLGATNTFTGAMTINAGTVTLAADQSLSSTLTISAGTLGISTYTIAVAGTSTIAGTLTISTGTYDANGTFDATGGTITFSGAGYLKLGGATVTSLGTTFTCGSGTVDYDYAGAQNVIATSYNNLTTSSSGTKSLTGTTYIAGTGVLTVNTGTTLAIGSYTLDKTTFGTSTSVIDGTVTLSTGTWVPTYGASSALTTNGTITVTGTGLIYLRGGGTHSLGTFTCGTGTVYYDRNGAQTVVTATYYNIIFSNSGTKTSGAAFVVTNDLTIDATVTLDVSASNYGITITGNWINNGTYTARSGNVTFTGANQKTISGSSATAFYDITINKGSDITSIIEATGPMSVTDDVTFTKGLLRLTHASSSVTDDLITTPADIASGAGLHVNGGTYSTGTSYLMNNSGYVRVTSGTATIGKGSDNGFYNEAATSVFILDGGTVNLPGRFNSKLGSSTISSGTLTIGTTGINDNTYATFDVGTGSDLSIIGGSIYLRTKNSGSTGDIKITAGGTKSITGGTFYIGDGSTVASSTFLINSAISLYNLTINTTNTPTAQLSAALTVSNDFVNGGVFDAKSGSNYGLTVGGAFTNNGTFTARAGTVTLNGSSAQTISGTTDPNFYNFTLSNASGASISLNTTVQSAFTFTNGKFTTQGYTLTLGTNGTNGSVSGYTSARYFVAYDNSGTIGSVKQFVNQKTSTDYVYPIGDLTNYTPFTFTVNSASTLAAGAYFTMYTKAATISGLNASVTTYLTRFWRGTDFGITTPNYDISYAYSASDVIGGTEANLMPIKKSGTTWYKPTGSTFTTGTAVGTGGFTVGTRTLTWAGLTSFSDYGGVGPEAVGLPIELIKFEGKKLGYDNELLWSTETEINNDYFTIEKTTDGVTFETVGTQNGAGNSNSVLKYSLIDQNVQKVINYYRLIQTDFDGKNTISKLITIDNRDFDSTVKIVSSITNILGQEINDNYRGLIIITYSDGSSIKTIR